MLSFEWVLIPIAFATSVLTAAIGLGGGVLLLAVMPGLLPVAAIIPVHGATQLGSNAFRVLLGIKYVDRALVLPLVVGSLLGAILGAMFYQTLSLDYLPLIIGVTILLITWCPPPIVSASGRWGFALLGLYQTGLGMVVGTTGPLGAALLARRSTARDYLVINTGLYMTINHLLRTIAFTVMGFAYGQYALLLLAVVVAVGAGAWLGTRLRQYIPDYNFHYWFKGLITLLAFRLIASVWF